MKKLLYIYIVLNAVFLYAQEKDTLNTKPLDEYILIKKGDTLTIELEELRVLSKHKFKSVEDSYYYAWFRRKVFKAYPYARLASIRLDTLNSRLLRIESKRKRKKHIKIAQKYLEGEFTEQLKKMTRTEGRILIKLIHRQTGKTVFDNIKELRSGWKAFWYNTTANLFKLSLKTKYNPQVENEDFLIEDVLQRAFIDGKLHYQPSKLPYNLDTLALNKKTFIDVEEYKRMFAKLKKKRLRKKKREDKRRQKKH